MRWLLTLFVVVPFIELVLLVALGQLLGFWPTVLLIVVTGVSGAFLARHQGLHAFRSWNAALARGERPEETIASGLLLLVGCVLLVTPGLLTDIAGLTLLIPISRRWLARALLRRVTSQALANPSGFSFYFRSYNAHPWPPGRQPQPHRSPPIIEVTGKETQRQ